MLSDLAANFIIRDLDSGQYIAQVSSFLACAFSPFPTSIIAVRVRSLRRRRRMNQRSPPRHRPAPLAPPLPQRRSATTTTTRRPAMTTTPPSSWPRPTGPPATPLPWSAGRSARTPSASLAHAIHCRSTCSTLNGFVMAAGVSATGQCSSKSWTCPRTWTASTRSSTSSGPSLWERWSPTASALMCSGQWLNRPPRWPEPGLEDPCYCDALYLQRLH